jgi:four helix bundle protein
MKKFEDIKVWNTSKLFVKTIYSLTYDIKMKRDYGFQDQIRRASVSIMNNIAEGYERNNDKELIKFLKYSKGSAGEVRSMLHIALELGYITSDQFRSTVEQSLDIVTQLSNFISHVQSRVPDKKKSRE